VGGRSGEHRGYVGEYLGPRRGRDEDVGGVGVCKCAEGVGCAAVDRIGTGLIYTRDRLDNR
jgi:hypothetical protein